MKLNYQCPKGENAMKLNYQCPICGTPLGYEGLCWKCKSEQDRQSVMNWTAEQIKEKQELLISNIQRLANMEDWTDSCPTKNRRFSRGQQFDVLSCNAR